MWKEGFVVGFLVCVLFGVLFLGLVYDRPDYSPEKIEVSFRPNLLYPSGKIIYYDGFESPTLNWEIGGDASYSGVIQTSLAWAGAAALKLVSGTTSDYHVRAQKKYGGLISRKIGVQGAWSVNSAAYNNFEIFFTHLDKTSFHEAKVKYDRANNKWQYYDWDEEWQDIPGASENLGTGQKFFHFVKLIIDLETKKYVRLYSDEQSWDLSELSYFSGDSTAAEIGSVYFSLYALDDTQLTMYLDEVAITEE